MKNENKEETKETKETKEKYYYTVGGYNRIEHTFYEKIRESEKNIWYREIGKHKSLPDKYWSRLVCPCPSSQTENIIRCSNYGGKFKHSVSNSHPKIYEEGEFLFDSNWSHRCNDKAQFSFLRLEKEAPEQLNKILSEISECKFS